MKNIFLLFSLTLLMTSSMFAQQTSNLVIFAEEITPFYAIVNGIKQNSELETNVRITGLTNPANQIKIVFQDRSIPTIDKQVYFQAMDVEVTMKIKNTKKGYKLRYFGEIAMNSAPVNDGIPTVSYHTTYIEDTYDIAVETIPATTTTVVTEETVIIQNGTPTNGTTTTNTESVNVNMNMGGVDMNMSVNVSETNGTTNSTGVVNQNVGIQTSSSTTTTTTTTNIPQDVVIVESSNVVYVDGYSGSIGCEIPSQNMNNIIGTIENESFSDDKMMIAKQATRDKCLTTEQVIRIMNMFSFEDDKLDFAKYAYDRTYDIDNYYQVTSVFTFSDAKEELNNYIMNR